jgi:hypothetical protein
VLERIPVQSLGANPDEIFYGSDGERCQRLGISMVADVHQELLQVFSVRSYGRGLQTAHPAQMIREKIQLCVHASLRPGWDRLKTAILYEKVLNLANGSRSFRSKVTIVFPGCLKRALAQFLQTLRASLLEIRVDQPSILELISHSPYGEATIVRPCGKLIQDGAHDGKGKVPLVGFRAKGCNHLNLLSNEKTLRRFAVTNV